MPQLFTFILHNNSHTVESIRIGGLLLDSVENWVPNCQSLQVQMHASFFVLIKDHFCHVCSVVSAIALSCYLETVLRDFGEDLGQLCQHVVDLLCCISRSAGIFDVFSSDWFTLQVGLITESSHYRLIHKNAVIVGAPGLFVVMQIEFFVNPPASNLCKATKCAWPSRASLHPQKHWCIFLALGARLIPSEYLV